MTHVLKVCLFSILVAASGCGGADGASSVAAEHDHGAALETTVTAVIIPTYRQLAERATALRVAAEQLSADPTEERLAAAKAAWVATRVHWEQSEAFLFGPASDLAIDGAIDSWPVDSVQVSEVLSSSIALSADTVRSDLGGGLKGFHTIEFLLWGDDSKKPASELQGKPREREYLVALATALEGDVATLAEAWASGESPYGKAFYLAGKPGGKLLRQVDALQQLVNGMIGICDEVANGKIADPYKARDPLLVESQFSFNSIDDFADNIRSVKHIYSGSLTGVAPSSLSRTVNEADPSLDARVHAELDAAIAAIAAISADGVPFRAAISDPSKQGLIEDAQEKIRKLMATLEGDVRAVLLG